MRDGRGRGRGRGIGASVPDEHAPRRPGVGEPHEPQAERPRERARRRLGQYADAEPRLDELREDIEAFYLYAQAQGLLRAARLGEEKLGDHGVAFEADEVMVEELRER